MIQSSGIHERAFKIGQNFGEQFVELPFFPRLAMPIVIKATVRSLFFLSRSMSLPKILQRVLFSLQPV